MSSQFWMCMKCQKHLRGTAQEVSTYAQEHMCEQYFNVSRCQDCVTETTELTNAINDSSKLETSPSPLVLAPANEKEQDTVAPIMNDTGDLSVPLHPASSPSKN